MRPTKEMILETKQLVSQTDESIKEIIRANDLELDAIRNKSDSEKPVNPKIIYAAVILLSLLLTYPVIRFFISR